MKQFYAFLGFLATEIENEIIALIWWLHSIFKLYSGIK